MKPAPAAETSQRRLPVGAEPQPDGSAHFRVWAPGHRAVELVLQSADGQPVRHKLASEPDADGYFSFRAAGAPAGTRYGFVLDGQGPFSDPASRYQPDGPAGLSAVVDPGQFRWSDEAWPGVTVPGQVLYEMHVGTFTPEGTWQAAAEQLEELADLGVTVIEVMPVADWPGDFGWGYDGVNLFAPTRLYGEPDDFRAFVDQAHTAGLGVLLDVVYNHIGRRECTLDKFSPAYFSNRYENEWGHAVNFDGQLSEPVREFVLANVRYWIEEFHLDGYRVDATQAFFDESPEHILTALTRAARAAAGSRQILLVAESEPQDARMIRPLEQGGFGMDVAWNDDFHHSAMVRLTGRNEAYYSDYLGTAAEFVALVKWGYLYQGQRYEWQEKRRGSPSFDLPPAALVNYLQNHDQVANTGNGGRVHGLTSPGRLRAMTALWLLMPQTPMLFQGQEFAARAPFCYFLDNPPEIAAEVAEGRAKFLRQFRSLALPEVQRRLADPANPLTFRSSKLQSDQRAGHPEVYALHKDLLALRRGEPALAGQCRKRLDAATLSPDALVVRYFGPAQDDCLLVVNFGLELRFDPAPEPLLAPPRDSHWTLRWSSEELCYGGTGTPPLEGDWNWRLPGEAAVLLKAAKDKSST